MATRSKGKDEQDNPIHFSGDLRDWQAFKQAIQSLADRKVYGWLFDTGKALYDFYVSQVRDKTGTVSRSEEDSAGAGDTSLTKAVVLSMSLS